ncbi:MAG: DUF115 domain-containing protein [Treponema sp.]|nr:DUF115 domain-containing protein [Treponema sp.]
MVKNGKTILSGVDPCRRADSTADSISITDRTLYFCPSPVYGYGLSRLLLRLENEAPSSAVLCVEADSELYELSCNNIDPILKENKKLFITNIYDNEKIYAIVNKNWGARAFRRIELIRFTGGYQLFPQIYDSLNESLRRNFANDWSNALTLAKMGRLYIRNFIRNLPLIPQFPSIESLSFGEAPVLVLGAGPSLDKVLNALPKTFKFKIICADTCLGILKDRNITPDLAVILESQHWNLRDFIGCRGWNVSAAIDLSSLPASAKKLNGEGFLFFTPWTPLRIFERLKNAGLLPGIIPPLGSVGLTAVELARRLTNGKIICAGLDFSFTADMYHARSAPGHRDKLNKQTRLKSILNNAVFNEFTAAAVSKSGLQVKTSPIMKNYRNLFEQEFGGDERIFDIEGSGLPLGVKTLSIEEAMEKITNCPQIFAESSTEPSNRRFGGEGSPLDFRGDHKERSEEFCPASFSSTLIPSAISAPPCLCENSSGINSFIENEIKLLEELRNILSGEAAMNTERLGELITECDYLWAHFPDYAGGFESGNNPNINDVSFLKRVRIEIDMMLKLLVSGF